MMPHANDCTSMCVHSIESIESSDMAWPSSILFTWCSCAVTAVLRSNAAARAACLALRPMLTLDRAEMRRQAPHVLIALGRSLVEILDGSGHIKVRSKKYPGVQSVQLQETRGEALSLSPSGT